MFQKGDSVVYGNLGVCKINDLVTRQFEGLDEAHPYYVLKPLYQEGVLYVPADNPKIALRAVLTADEANQLIDSIPSLHGEAFHSRSAQELAELYRAVTDAAERIGRNANVRLTLTKLGMDAGLL